jgi:hypothetical protein
MLAYFNALRLQAALVSRPTELSWRPTTISCIRRKLKASDEPELDLLYFVIGLRTFNQQR